MGKNIAKSLFWYGLYTISQMLITIIIICIDIFRGKFDFFSSGDSQQIADGLIEYINRVTLPTLIFTAIIVSVVYLIFVLTKKEKVVIVNRERTADGQPVVFSYNVFPEKYVGNIFDDGLHGSIFQILKEICNIEIDHALTNIKGINKANQWDSEAMVFLNGPMILLEQLHVDKEGKAVLFSFDYIRTDLVELHVRREM